MVEQNSLGKAQGTFEYFKIRAEELRLEAKRNGFLKKQDIWNLEYFENPYLILETDEKIRERFKDLITNTYNISENCQVVPYAMDQDSGRFWRYFAEIIHEGNWRGTMTGPSLTDACSSLRAYFQDGPPVGCRLFKGSQKLSQPCLVKYSKSQYVSEMHKFGRFRISAAKEYSKGSHIKAIRDLETSRPYQLKALSEVLKGKKTINAQGIKMEIVNGFIPLNVEVENYYLFSTCKEIDRRMPTDFEADAALIIKNRSAFLERMKAALLEKFPTWEFLDGEVYYYDPYNDIPNVLNQEFWKHISYAHQKEHRCVLRPRFLNFESLDPIFVELGSLEDIAEAVYAP